MAATLLLASVNSVNWNHIGVSVDYDMVKHVKYCCYPIVGAHCSAVAVCAELLVVNGMVNHSTVNSSVE